MLALQDTDAGTRATVDKLTLACLADNVFLGLCCAFILVAIRISCRSERGRRMPRGKVLDLDSGTRPRVVLCFRSLPAVGTRSTPLSFGARLGFGYLDLALAGDANDLCACIFLAEVIDEIANGGLERANEFGPGGFFRT